MAHHSLCEYVAQPYLEAPVDSRRWYALCGPRMYSVVTLAGGFPDRGLHQPHEMGGVWAPPLKLLDGYWLGLHAQGEAVQWLTAPHTWRIAPEGVTLSYTLPGLGVAVERREWIVPDERALVIDVTLSSEQAASGSQLPSLTCGLLVRSDLHGAWLAEERLGWVDGDDSAAYDEALGAVLFHDRLHPAWQVCVGATSRPVAWEVGQDVWGPEHTSGRGTGAALWYRCPLRPGQPARMRLLIAGSIDESTSAAPVFARLALPADDAPGAGDTAAAAEGARPLKQAEQAAMERFRAPFARCILQSPDEHLNRVFAWAKAWSAMLLLDVPGPGRGVMAGLPEFPWWFGCDTAYGVLPMLPAGQTEEACSSLRTLATLSQQVNANGAVAHEIVSHGLVAHRGNLVETPLFARALYHTYRWSGDRALLEELFPFCLQGIERWALGACLEPGERVPRGSSIIETPEMADGLQALDVAVYLVEALDLLAALASELGQQATAARLHRRADALRQHVRDEWWLPTERLFGDVRASRAELESLQQQLELLSSPDPSQSDSLELLRRVLADDLLPATDPNVRRPWLLHHTVQALAADAGLPGCEQARGLLDRLETPEWIETYGMVLNARSNRHVMTLPTGALAVGEARYGRPDQALSMIQRMAAAFGAFMPGTLSEYAPDGGDEVDGGCFLQLWSNYGVIWPIIHYFFGVRPDVAKRHLACVPQLPGAWPSARLSALPLGETEASIELLALPDGLRVGLEIGAAEWEVALGAALPDGVHIVDASLNGASVVLQAARLTEQEGRQTWLAPASQGATHYDLRISWARDVPATHF